MENIDFNFSKSNHKYNSAGDFSFFIKKRNVGMTIFNLQINSFYNFYSHTKNVKFKNNITFLEIYEFEDNNFL